MTAVYVTYCVQRDWRVLSPHPCLFYQYHVVENYTMYIVPVRTYNSSKISLKIGCGDVSVTHYVPFPKENSKWG